MAAQAKLPRFPFLGCSDGRLRPPEAREPEEMTDPADEIFGPEKAQTGYGNPMTVMMSFLTLDRT